MTRRRLLFSFISLAACLGSFGLASAVDGQKPTAPWRIGVLLVAPDNAEVEQFRQGLREAGHVEGRDVVIEWRSANGDFGRIPELADELIQLKLDVIVVETTPGAQALKRATFKIPIVMALVADPVGSGLVASFAHPGGNITGLSAMVIDLTAKRLQLLKEAIPRLTRVAVIWNPDSPFHSKVIEDFKAVAPSLSIELTFVTARTLEEIGPAFTALNRAHAQALYVVDDGFFAKHHGEILELASKGKLPVFGDRGFTESGGLISYGASFGDMYRRAAGYVDKILKGAKPGDLPIEQPTKFELVVNLKTAKTLGIAIPESILLRADQLIR